MKRGDLVSIDIPLILTAALAAQQSGQGSATEVRQHLPYNQCSFRRTH
jgi:hypothetical protein